MQKIGADIVGFISGTLGILKILLTGKVLEAVTFTTHPGLEQIAEKRTRGRLRLLSAFDAERRLKEDTKLQAPTAGMDRPGVNFQTGINGATIRSIATVSTTASIHGGTEALKPTDDKVVRGQHKTCTEFAANGPFETPRPPPQRQLRGRPAATWRDINEWCRRSARSPRSRRFCRFRS